MLVQTPNSAKLSQFLSSGAVMTACHLAVTLQLHSPAFAELQYCNNSGYHVQVLQDCISYRLGWFTFLEKAWIHSNYTAHNTSPQDRWQQRIVTSKQHLDAQWFAVKYEQSSWAKSLTFSSIIICPNHNVNKQRICRHLFQSCLQTCLAITSGVLFV